VTKRAVNEKRTRSRTSVEAKQPPRRGREEPAEGAHDRPAGVQGPNVGYWQAVGSTRAAAKRSKRP
jgi:hypothetical protein